MQDCGVRLILRLYDNALVRSVIPLLISCLLLITVPGYVQANEDSQIDASIALKDTLKTIEGTDRSTIAWWIPGSAWKELITSDESLKEQSTSINLDALEDYDVFMVIDLVKEEDGYRFSSAAELEGAVELRDSAGHVWEPLSEREISSDAAELLQLVKPYMAQMIGLDDASNMHLLLFQSGNPDGEQFLDENSAGFAVLTVNQLDIQWTLPFGAPEDIGESSPTVDNASLSARERAEALNQEGLQLALGGDLEGALKKFDAAIAADPTFWEPAFTAGVVSELMAQYEGAIEYYSLAIQVDSQCLDAYLNRGDLYMALGQPAKAVEDYSQVLDLDPTMATVYFNRGNAYVAMGDLEAAIEDYTMTSALQPELVETYFLKAVICESVGRYVEAKSAYEEFVARAPEEYAQYVELARQKIEEMAEY